MFLNLASDSSKLVRTGALQHLGRLISTLPGDSVSEDLVRYFTGTAVESMGDPVVSKILGGRIVSGESLFSFFSFFFFFFFLVVFSVVLASTAVSKKIPGGSYLTKRVAT